MNKQALNNISAYSNNRMCKTESKENKIETDEDFSKKKTKYNYYGGLRDERDTGLVKLLSHLYIKTCAIHLQVTIQLWIKLNKIDIKCPPRVLPKIRWAS